MPATLDQCDSHMPVLQHLRQNSAVGRDSLNSAEDAGHLYQKLESEILPTFYNNHDRYVGIMRHCIAINGSFFNTQRMLHQYVLNAYFR